MTVPGSRRGVRSASRQSIPVPVAFNRARPQPSYVKLTVCEVRVAFAVATILRTTGARGHNHFRDLVDVGQRGEKIGALGVYIGRDVMGELPQVYPAIIGGSSEPEWSVIYDDFGKPESNVVPLTGRTVDLLFENHVLMSSP